MPVKTSYSNFGRHAKSDQKRKDGEARNEAWRSLTPEQQIESLQKRRGNSAKQLGKLAPTLN